MAIVLDKYDMLLAAPVLIVAGLCTYYAYKSRVRFFLYVNIPYQHGVVKGGFVKLRNLIYRNTLQDRLWSYIEARSVEGNADSVLAAFDDYSYNYEWTWAIGDIKASILTKVVQDAKPNLVLELGTFVGYSTVIIAQNLPEEGKIITVEADSKSTETARKIIDRAGFGNKVTVINGYSHDIIPTLNHDFGVETLDMVFLDHTKVDYTNDLQRLEKGGFLHNGSVIFADNIMGEGSPGFSEYLRSSGHYDCQFFKADLQYNVGISDGMERAIFKGAEMFRATGL